MALPHTTAAIRVQDLTYAWPDRPPILKDCSLSIPPGQLWMLLGANGSGKSTLLQLLGGLLPKPELASIWVEDPVGFVFQNPDHQLVMPTVGADVAFGLVSEGLSWAQTRQRVEMALEQVGLRHLLWRPIHSLSGGQKQRVAVAGALARRCRVLLLDEPTALLDPESQDDLGQQIRHLVDAQQITALWITHRLEELRWADGVALLVNGCVLEQGSPAQLQPRIESFFGLRTL